MTGHTRDLDLSRWQGRKRAAARLFGAVCLVLLAACGAQKPAEEDALFQLGGPASKLKVDGLAVPQALVESFARQRGWDLRDPGQAEQVHAQLAELVAVAREAQRRGLLDDAGVRAELAFERLNKLSGLLVQRELDSKPITEDDLRAQYESQLEAAGREEWLVAHILYESPEAARAAGAGLAAGQAFDALMAAARGQAGVRDARELGWVRPPQLPAPLAEALRELPPGSQLNEPVATEFGHHLALLRERRAFTPPPFEQLRDNIRSSMERQRAVELARTIRERSEVSY